MKNLNSIRVAILLAVCTLTAVVNSNIHANEGNPNVVVAPHCEVPCGIYADQVRFQQMLEDAAPIEKSITSINEFVAGGAPSAKGINQTMRWVTTKEDHATNTQHIVAQYFLTQRIKADNEKYVDQLKAAHAVMVAAMKCKQDADAKTAETLKNAIYDLYRAYEGKEPDFHTHEK